MALRGPRHCIGAECTSGGEEGGQASTPVMLGATAGLRLLPGTKAEQILAAVVDFLKNYPFQLDAKQGVSILDGASSPPPLV